ncbi:hypothetical protein [Thermus sp. NEB1569]|uniref:hypothetical protein n=1 Tax=Thermus sp. NEB1569 TaxID=2918899 RepID=UPI001EFB2CF4|nr:hypothetical protein [Thermus sp. NEB1569]ULR39695.1 hypothetical protein MI302_00365 [Thermus sp. NEB1569]
MKKKGSEVHEVLAELASEGRLLALEAQDLLRTYEQMGQSPHLAELELLKAYLEEVRRVRQALYSLVARRKRDLEDNTAEELRRLFL